MIKIFKNSIIVTFLLLIMIGTVAASYSQIDDLLIIDFDSGLIITGNSFKDIEINNSFTYNFHVFDGSSGIMLDNASCYYHLFKDKILDEGIYSSNITNDNGIYSLNENINVSGPYILGIRCIDTEINATKGGYIEQSFDVSEETVFGFWKPVENWTFPGIYLIITALLIILALNYQSQIIGVFGSIMLIFSYFLIGATAPLLFTPLLIIGLLLAFKFSTI